MTLADEPLRDNPHGAGWKAYFIFLMIYWLVIAFTEGCLDGFRPYVLVAYLANFFLQSTVMYSWIWARPIPPLVKLRWLIKLWSTGFFFAPLAFLVHAYVVFLGHANQEIKLESIGWLIAIPVNYPGLYIIYRIAWKSHLLYAQERKPIGPHAAPAVLPQTADESRPVVTQNRPVENAGDQSKEWPAWAAYAVVFVLAVYAIALFYNFVLKG